MISLLLFLLHILTPDELSTVQHAERHVTHFEKHVDKSFFPPVEPVIREIEPNYEVITVEATAYTSKCNGCTGITKTGYNVKNTIYTPNGHRIIAVDPNVIPLGSLVRIGSETYRALDIGGAIRGKRIDILFASRENAYKFGRRVVNVEILEVPES